MDLKLSNKVVLIVGGAGKTGSIGETIVRHLVREGAIPAIIDRDDRGIAMEKSLHEEGVDAMFVATDVTDPFACGVAVDKISAKYGRIDILVNNVGVNDSVGLEDTYEEFIDSLKLNLASYFLLAKLSLPLLKASRGTILNIGSKVALTGQGGTSGYAASKGGVLALTREWAVDLIAYGIRVNALIIAESNTPAYNEWLETFPDPAEVKDQIISKIPLGKRMTTPNEIANAALFLVSELSSHTTGQFVFVDGGYVHLDRTLNYEREKSKNRIIEL